MAVEGISESRNSKNSNRTRSGFTNKISCNKDTTRRNRLIKKFDHQWNTILLCPMLAKEQYLNGHDKVYAELRVDICKGMVVKLYKDQWC